MNSVALLFPGQGAQAVGMGKDLSESFPQARLIFDEANTLLGFDLKKLCFEGPAEQLTRTEFCQPALYVTSLAAWGSLQAVLQQKKYSLQPAAAAGLSLGEYTALAAGGAYSFEDGLQLVRLRGQAMEEAAGLSSGMMASILGMQLTLLEEICQETGAQIANINSPGQIVISGSRENVRAASAKAQEKGAQRVIPLEVGGAFHSRLMEPAAQKLGTALQSVAVKVPAIPVLSNVTGDFHTTPDQIRKLLVRQLTSPVQWEGSIRTLINKGIRTFFELGSGTVLKGLVRKIEPEGAVYSVGTAEHVHTLAADLLSQKELDK